MCCQPNCSAFKGSVCIVKVADMESLLYYTILYKTVECVWIFVFRGSCNQSPIDTEDDCILVIICSDFLTSVIPQCFKVYICVYHTFWKILSLSFQILTLFYSGIHVQHVSDLLILLSLSFLFNIFHLFISLYCTLKKFLTRLKVNSYLGLSCLITYLRFLFYF